MADLIAAYNSDNTLTNVGVNFEQMNAGFNALGPRTRIISLTDSGDNITEAEAVSFIKNLTQAGGSSGSLSNDSDAFTIAGMSGVPGSTQTLYFAIQGTGTLDLSDAANGVGTHTVAVVADFKQPEDTDVDSSTA